jgi:ATP-dependent DNA helicase RecQ
MSGKPVDEQEWFCIVANRLYTPKPQCLDAVLLHYFGEEFDDVTGEGADMDDTQS